MIKWILISIVALVALFGGTMAFRYYTAEVRGIVPAEERIQSADFRIYSYNHFFDLLAGIRKAEAMYDTQYDLFQTLTEGTARFERQARVVSVQKAYIEQLKQQYNADAGKEKTMGQFRASNLPARVDTSPHEYGRRTKITWAN